MSGLQLRCIMCGKTQEVLSDHPNFKKLSDPEKPAAYVCDICNYKIRHESEEARKPTRPTSN
ncbi:MAG: DUF2197 domain-containing protein [Syntrophomonadaceae bacterium]|nr:DUF2197 domain-containing protein [Syntrophomonadaceae bacterium]